MKCFIFLLLFAFVELVSGQDCHNDLVVKQSILKKQNVKKVSVYEIDSATQNKFLHFEFFLHPNGSVYKTVRHAPEIDMKGVAECSCTKDSLEYTNSTYIEDKTGKKDPMEKRVMTYNKKHELIKRTQETFGANHLIHITYFNPDDPNESHIEVVTFQGNDTVRRVEQLHNLNLEIFVFREKKEGIWQVKKTVNHYQDAKQVSSEEYVNGKLTHTKKFEKDEEELPEGDGREKEYGLPYVEKEAKNTVSLKLMDVPACYTKHLNQKLVGKMKTMKVETRYTDDSMKTPYMKSFYYNSGLLFIQHSLVLGYYTLHEYEFYK